MDRQKTAIIVGADGQDGTLLTADLEKKGYQIVGISRGHTDWGPFRNGRSVDIQDQNAVRSVMQKCGPSEIYYLAAYHTSSEKTGILLSDAELFRRSQSVHVAGLLNFLEVMADVSPTSRLFYASSSLVFSGRHGDLQDETTPLEPVGMYGITKAQGMWLCKEYREKQKLFASCGILYNHESALRPRSFLTAKIIKTAIEIATGSDKKIEVGNLKAQVDWGYAPDYVAAFEAILGLEEPDDYILATGEAHSVEKFLAVVFGHFGLDWHDHVVISSDILFRLQPTKRGDATKLLNHTGIRLHRPFEEIVHRLIKDHLNAAGLLI